MESNYFDRIEEFAKRSCIVKIKKGERTDDEETSEVNRMLLD